MTLAAIRSGVVSSLSGVTGLNVYSTAPGAIEAPAAIVELLSVEPQLCLGSGLARYEIEVAVCVNEAAGNQVAQTSLDAYCGHSGSGSVAVALTADKTLGGASEAVDVARLTYGLREFAGVQYLCAVFPVSVWASA